MGIHLVCCLPIAEVKNYEPQSTNTTATLMTTRQTREQHKDKRILYASQEEVMETTQKCRWETRISELREKEN